MVAIVIIAGKQYAVSVGETLEVDSLTGEVGNTVSFDQVLLVTDGESTTVGTPVVSGKKVEAKILEQKKGEKIEVRRYKAKVRYRRKRGFRAHLTKLEIVSIG